MDVFENFHFIKRLQKKRCINCTFENLPITLALWFSTLNIKLIFAISLRKFTGNDERTKLDPQHDDNLKITANSVKFSNNIKNKSSDIEYLLCNFHHLTKNFGLILKELWNKLKSFRKEMKALTNRLLDLVHLLWNIPWRIDDLY